MSFVTNALGISNGYTTQSGAGGNSSAQQATDQTNFTNVQANQGNLASQLLAQSQGQGPNIANLQLQQATNQNNQQAAGQIASQRGMNPALAQRLIANQTAMNNQNAAGQSGVLRAQQQLASQQGLANVYGQQAGEAEANLGRLTQAQTAANQSNAQIAQANSNQAGQLAGGLLGGAASAFGLSQGGEVSPHVHLERLLISLGNKVKPKHFDDGGIADTYSSEDSAAMPLSAGTDPSHQEISAADAISGSKNAIVQEGPNGVDPMNDAVNAENDSQTSTSPNAPHGKFSTGFKNAMGNQPLSNTVTPAAMGNLPMYNFASPQSAQPWNPLMRAKGGLVPAMISPGERVIPPHLVQAVAKGHKKASEVAPKVPGKAKVKGDSEENDTVPAKLAEGSVVIKRTKADNDKDAREFLLAIRADKEKKEGPSGYTKVLAARRKNG
jgi:hypothetical protein